MPINAYLSSLIQSYQTPNMFSVFIDPPNSLSPRATLNKPDYGSILCRSAQLPGITVNSDYAVFNNKKHNYATGIDFDDITLEFYSDSRAKTLAFFWEWMSAISIPTNMGTRLTGFKDDYTASIQIVMHPRLLWVAGQETVNFSLIRAYPVNISPVQLSHDETDSIVRFSVSFKYDDVKFTFDNGLTSTLLSLGINFASIATGLTI